MHADLSNGCVGNMRMFEATGMGSCLLNDYGSNLSELFEDGKEISSKKSKVRKTIPRINKRKNPKLR